MNYLKKRIPGKVLVLNGLPNNLIWYSPVLLLWDTLEVFTWEHKQVKNSLTSLFLPCWRGPSLINFFVCSVAHVSLFILGHPGYTFLYLLKLCYIFMEVRTASTIQEVAATPMSYTSIIIFLFVLYDLHNNSELFFAVFFVFCHTLSWHLLSTMCLQLLSWNLTLISIIYNCNWDCLSCLYFISYSLTVIFFFQSHHHEIFLQSND